MSANFSFTLPLEFTPKSELSNFLCPYRCVKYAIISVLVIWDGDCVNDQPRVYSHTKDIGDSNDVEACEEYCFDEGYNYMGVEGKTWCRCGHSPPPLANRLAEGDCDWECPGNSKETCGGAYKMNVYQIEKGDFLTNTLYGF